MSGPLRDTYLDELVIEEAAHRFYRAEDANLPTRLMALAYALDLHSRHSRLLESILEDDDADFVESQLRGGIGSYLSYLSLASLCKHLHAWARQQGITSTQSPSSLRTHGGLLWCEVMFRIDWAWVRERLQDEWKRHRRRAINRMQELRTGIPFEHIEAREEQRRARRA